LSHLLSDFLIILFIIFAYVLFSLEQPFLHVFRHYQIITPSFPLLRHLWYSFSTYLSLFLYCSCVFTVSVFLSFVLSFSFTPYPSISSMLNVRIFRTNVVFSSYVWLGAKNLHKKCARKTLMKLTLCLFPFHSFFSSFSFTLCLSFLINVIKRVLFTFILISIFTHN